LQISSFLSKFVEESVLSSLYVFGTFVKSQEGCKDSYLHLLFYSTCLHVCFCASAMLFLLLYLYSIVWSQILWYLLHCSCCPPLPWLFLVFCASKWNLGFIFQSLWWMS
jgi:hypothetical protein